jgi:transketolase N-terminal domain/subunit
VKEYAFDCSGVVLSTINKYLVQNSGDDTSKKVLNKTLKEILPVFNENGIDDDTFSFTLQSLGHFAGAIYALLGAKSLVKIEDRVKQFGESLLVLNEKTTAVKWSLFTQYINCIGHFVSEVVDFECYTYVDTCTNLFHQHRTKIPL